MCDLNCALRNPVHVQARIIFIRLGRNSFCIDSMVEVEFCAHD